MRKKITLAAITGPTASGKTALAIEIAKCIDGEIISCDSMQIYKRMNIGTAKPAVEERKGIPHHLIDIAEPWENFSCSDYAVKAALAIEEVSSKGRTPILCGGTGLYMDSALNPNRHCECGADIAYREQMYKFARENGQGALHALLGKVDQSSAGLIHPNNVKRVIRALEIYKSTGRTKSEWDRMSAEVDSGCDVKAVCIDFENRDELYSRINARVDFMFDNGLESEVRKLFENGDLREGTTSSQAIGYKELVDFFEGKCTLEQAKEEIKKNTRNYAKRQQTWFSSKGYPKVYADKCLNYEEIVKNTLEVLGMNQFMV